MEARLTGSRRGRTATSPSNSNRRHRISFARHIYTVVLNCSQNIIHWLKSNIDIPSSNALKDENHVQIYKAKEIIILPGYPAVPRQFLFQRCSSPSSIPSRICSHKYSRRGLLCRPVRPQLRPKPGYDTGWPSSLFQTSCWHWCESCLY